MRTPQPRVLIVCDHFPPSERAGGPPKSIFGIVKRETQHCQIAIITSDHDIGTYEAHDTADRQAVQRRLPGVSIDWIQRTGQHPTFRKAFRERIIQSDVIYLNSVFSPTYSIFPLLLMRLRFVPRRPIMLAPRGELSPGALSIRRQKKRLALPLLRWLLSELNVIWHASSQHEANDISKFLGAGDNRILVRANPAPPPASPLPPTPSNELLTVAFVARMAPIKNFKLLAQAAALSGIPMRLVIAGPIEDQDYWAGCCKILRLLEHQVKVDVVGHVQEPDVMRIMKQADAMVLPTRGENFGRSIAEALSVGCPVMVPDTTLWTPLINRGAGTLIDTDNPAPLVNALQALFTRSVEDRASLRRRALEEYRQWWKVSQSPDSLFLEALGNVTGGLPTQSSEAAKRIQ